MYVAEKVVVVLSGDALLEYLRPTSSKFADENVVVVVPTSSLNYALSSEDFVYMDVYKKFIEETQINTRKDADSFSKAFIGEVGEHLVFFNDHYGRTKAIASDTASHPYTREDLAAISPAQWDDLLIAAAKKIRTRFGSGVTELYVAVSGANRRNASLIVYAKAWHDLKIGYLDDVILEVAGLTDY